MIVIPDMDMPTSCTKCPLFNMMDNRAFCFAKKDCRGGVYEMNPHFAQGGRQEWCPLIEKEPGIRILKRVLCF